MKEALKRRLKRMTKKQFDDWFKTYTMDRDAMARSPEEARAAEIMKQVLMLAHPRRGR